MSWSFSGIGKPEAVKRALVTSASNYSGQSKEEFDRAIPHLSGLLDMAHADAAVAVEANGHESWSDGKRTYASIGVSIRQLGAVCE